MAGARSKLTAAATTRDAAALANDQALGRLHHAATLAARRLQAARAAAEVSAEGGTPGQVAAAKALLRDARAQLVDGREAVADTILRAPFKGTVIDIAGGVGETPVGAVRGTSSGGAGGPGVAENRNPATQSGFVVLADLTHKSVTARVAERDVARVRVGQPATVVFPATGARVEGVVRTVAEQETLVDKVVAYNVGVSLKEPAAALRLGQSGSVRILTGEERKPRTVPNAAVLRSGERSLVQVRRGDRLVKLPVTVRPVDDSTSEVSSPLLRPDDEIVLPAPGEDLGVGREPQDVPE